MTANADWLKRDIPYPGGKWSAEADKSSGARANKAQFRALRLRSVFYGRSVSVQPVLLKSLSDECTSLMLWLTSTNYLTLTFWIKMPFLQKQPIIFFMLLFVLLFDVL